MKTQFELWLSKNTIPLNSKNLFEESIMCYKVGAYRSSFIMSYIAFQNILKERILSAAFAPSNINNWQTICNKLRDENAWDAEVSNCVNKNNPSRIFMINDGIVKQYESWRTIRNDCAHGKTNSITFSHIDTFWIFIMSNLSKFVINGGGEGIMQLIKDFFDITITPKNADNSHIIENIKLGISTDEMPDFIKNLLSYCDNELWFFGPFDKRYPVTSLWKRILNECGQNMHDSIIAYMKEPASINYLFNFIEAFPETADDFLIDPFFCRKLWTEVIFKAPRNSVGAWTLISKIILTNIIPQVELTDFNKNLYKWLGTYYSKEHITILKHTNYFKKLHYNLFEDTSNYSHPNGIYFANSNIYRIIEYIKDFGLDKDIVICINTVFSFASYGEFFERMKLFMKNNENFLADYKTIVCTENLKDYSQDFLEEN